MARFRKKGNVAIVILIFALLVPILIVTVLYFYGKAKHGVDIEETYE